VAAGSIGACPPHLPPHLPALGGALAFPAPLLPCPPAARPPPPSPPIAPGLGAAWVRHQQLLSCSAPTHLRHATKPPPHPTPSPPQAWRWPPCLSRCPSWCASSSRCWRAWTPRRRRRPGRWEPTTGR
jgi:hypothetical protein